jgi:hypothetical protein
MLLKQTPSTNSLDDPNIYDDLDENLLANAGSIYSAFGFNIAYPTVTAGIGSLGAGCVTTLLPHYLDNYYQTQHPLWLFARLRGRVDPNRLVLYVLTENQG